MPDKIQQLYLIGFPNSGKTTVFNFLTGLHQKTGNYNGVTLEHFDGTLKNNPAMAIRDLPGIYNLFTKEPEERITVDALLHSNTATGIILVLDALQLERQLLLATQILDLKKPTLIVLNKVEWAQKHGIEINTASLSHHLGVKCLNFGRQESAFYQNFTEALESIEFSKNVFNPKWKDLDYATLVQKQILYPEPEFESEDKRSRIQTARYITGRAQSRNSTIKTPFDLDRILMHPIGGLFGFFIIMGLMFQCVFWIAAYPMSWIEGMFSAVSALINESAMLDTWKSFWTDGIMNGLCGVFMFVPQIAILFACIAFLEESGYMTRAAIIMDRVFRPFGLNGKSMIPFISSTACAVPSVLATRTIASWRERLISILTLPLMSCSARLPVYTILIELLFIHEPAKPLLKGLILLAIYLAGFLSILMIAGLLNRIIPKAKKRLFVIELPFYQWPRWQDMTQSMWRKVKIFLKDAGIIILCLSVVLWYLGHHGPELKTLNKQPVSIETSYLGHAGKFIEPAIAPLGYDWKIGIALLSSFAAREVFVGTLSTLYPNGDSNKRLTIRLAEERHSNGNKVYTSATCWSLIVFYAFALQCMSTLAVVYRETGSWVYPTLQWLGYALMAYLFSWLTYQVCL